MEIEKASTNICRPKNQDKVKEQSKTMSYTEMMKLFNLSKSTISTIVKGKDKILEASGDGYDKKRIKIRRSDHLNLEKAVIMWLAQARNQNIPVSGPLLQEKAKKMAEKLSIDHFSASDGWLCGFKERHSIRFPTEQGEATSVDPQIVKQWKTDDLVRLTEGFNPDDVYNGDETGLFWRLLPNKTLCFKDDKCIGGKKSKERMTVLVCANASGTDKRKLLVIGKSDRPCCFENATLLVTYEANQRAWMTGKIFIKWLEKWDSELKQEDRRILLFLDNCSAHSKPNLQNIELRFFPPNTMSITQPMDQGIIQNIKVNYRRKILKRRIEAMDSNEEFKLNLLDSIFHLERAWKEVKQETIQNCFRKGGFSFEINDEIIDELIYKGKIEDMMNRLDIGDDVKFEDYIDADKGVVTSGLQSTEEVIRTFAGQDLDDNDEEEMIERLPVSIQQARQSFNIFRQYCQENSIDVELFPILDQFDEKLHCDRIAKMLQPKISDFYNFL